MKSKFKKGQWLIRQWKLGNGGETDFVMFDKIYNDKDFMTKRFYRFGKVFNDLSEYKDSINYIDYRMKFDFRKATKEEIEKYTFAIKYLTGK